MADQLVAEEPLIGEARKPQLLRLLRKLAEKHVEHDGREYGLFKVLRAHILPLTNCAFNKSGDRFITGSYDRTCKVWDTATGVELASLEGHKNVVYAISFNNPFGCVYSVRISTKTKCFHARSLTSPPPLPVPPFIVTVLQQVLLTKQLRCGTQTLENVCIRILAMRQRLYV